MAQQANDKGRQRVSQVGWRSWWKTAGMLIGYHEIDVD